MGAIDLMKIEGELRAPVATAQLVRFNFPEPIETLMHGTGTYRVDLCLTPRPRNARACGFRESRGISIGTHVTNQRAEHARSLLAADRSIKAIAHTLGFSSASGFTYAFRRATGETPGQFRRRLRRLH